VIFIDSNVPMYLVGHDDTRRVQAQRLLERAVIDRESLATDAEVFQEILHRYASIRRPDAIEPAFSALRGMVDTIFPIEFDDVERARQILATADLSAARDALHLAVMRAKGIDQIMSFDRGFDGISGIVRLGD